MDATRPEWPRTASRHTEIPAQLSQIVRGDIHDSRGIDKIAAGFVHGFFHDLLLELEDSGFKASNARLPGLPREHRFGQIFRLDEFVLAKDQRLFDGVLQMTHVAGPVQSKRSSPKIVCSPSPGASIMAAMRSIASRARSRPLTLTFDISQLPSLRK